MAASSPFAVVTVFSVFIVYFIFPNFLPIKVKICNASRNPRPTYPNIYRRRGDLVRCFALPLQAI